MVWKEYYLNMVLLLLLNKCYFWALLKSIKDKKVLVWESCFKQFYASHCGLDLWLSHMIFAHCTSPHDGEHLCEVILKELMDWTNCFRPIYITFDLELWPWPSPNHTSPYGNAYQVSSHSALVMLQTNLMPIFQQGEVLAIKKFGKHI